MNNKEIIYSRINTPLCSMYLYKRSVLMPLNEETNEGMSLEVQDWSL